MATKRRKSFRPITIFFETDPLTLESIGMVIKPEQDKEYAILRDKSNVTFMCFESITYKQLVAGNRYKFSGHVNVVPGNMFLCVQSFELLYESQENVNAGAMTISETAEEET